MLPVIYLAGRYSRRLELCSYRAEIIGLGFRVQSTWLNGDHQISDTGEPINERGEALVEGKIRPVSSLSAEKLVAEAAALRQRFAHEDFLDVSMCQLLIAFTEKPRGQPGRGGRHVELGIALGQMKKVWIVGPRENIFCWLDDVRQFDCFHEALNLLKEELD